MRLIVITVLNFICYITLAQNIDVKLSTALKQMEKDAQFKHAIISLYVVDSKTGKIVFDKNSQMGLAPASCLKVVTSAAALELLGKDYRYKTEVGYEGKVENDTLKGDLIITGYGDPTLGSFRWDATGMESVMNNIMNELTANEIKVLGGNLVIDETKWETQATPRGWTWEDIGNYYGAGARALNWNENQYDLILKPGKRENDPVEILGTNPELQFATLTSELKTGKAGSGDNSIIYLPEDGVNGFVRGTVPADEDNFKVSGSMPDVSLSFMNSISTSLRTRGIIRAGIGKAQIGKVFTSINKLTGIISPSLDSINYWFLQKSVNLYGEAFVKTISYEKTGFGATDTGLNIIKDFWSKNGIEKSALNIKDGSGLSPANRVTTNSLVAVMQYAKKQNWYSSFYNALPEQNGIKMKSGYIGGVRSYTGYIKSKTGNEYTFSFIINNFDGSPGAVREKMWKLLDILK